jgi:hypothetical protein
VGFQKSVKRYQPRLRLAKHRNGFDRIARYESDTGNVEMSGKEIVSAEFSKRQDMKLVLENRAAPFG